MLRRKIRLGDLLVEQGLISQKQLQTALEQQRQSGEKLGRQLIDLEFVSEDQILRVLSEQLEVPWVNPNDYFLDADVSGQLPENYARRFAALLLEETAQDFLVAMADPSDLIAYDELQRVLHKPVRVAVARESSIRELINLVYRRTEEISNIAEELGREFSSADDIDLSTLPVGEGGASAPVVRLLQSLFEDAVQVGASDIHIEPEERSLRIRTRRDGVLQEQIFRQQNIHAALVSLLKLMCGLNITERRLPQDGRFQVRVHGRSIDVRLSTLPLQHGEGVVMRLLDQTGGVSSLGETGMPEDLLQRLRRLIHMPYGMVLVTGPTGSGKSTTLYGALSEINRPGVKIITVEDPVEYRVPRINQVQVRESIGLTFARVLRTTLRQDPDIVMVGEMRDEETVDIGMRAAITGHLVFSTLHTNDAVSTANRLLDMGAEPYMLVAALRAILAQRLLRRICTKCRQPYTPNDQEHAWLQSVFGEDASRVQLYHGRGCPSCSQTGYSGRIGVFELLELNADMIEALRQGDQSGFAAACAADPGYRPMSHVALDYAQQGVTTLEEVFRVLGEMDESTMRDENRAVQVQAAEENAHGASSAAGTGAAPQARPSETTAGD
ncbi:GspE/PulE family protein [Halorhodospira sp. 9621]|uniref:GspE/PulE family protein n=1 Tax=Halorhodospira TaxID=85108 RepID=UPI001EE78D5E|nr:MULTISPECIES: GspE/PulE family protein [Halorhodospira]MCG5528642.1 GspE/PulE family protein [Halorhodospira halophila]MCG5533391.1 GspE/PulE family protein [Halorhodospira sp. 9621]MCG5543969.1 GspE/PulE family protein [Halorhodospira sp. 9628]